MTKLKKFKAKLGRRIRNIQESSDIQVTNAQQKAASIFRLSLKDEKAELLLMPIQNKRILKLDHKGTYIVLEPTHVSITNHQYSYMIEMSFKLVQKLANMFDRKLDESRSVQERAILNQIDTGLSNLLQKLKEETK
jgi:hypothetical protein